MSEPKPHLICYDIADPKRLSRVHRCVSKKAHQVQYSVYHLIADLEEIDELLGELEYIINSKEDDVRVYRIPPLEEAEWLGPAWLPHGITMITQT